MSIRWLKTTQSASIVFGMILMTFIGIPASWAGGALIIERDEKVFAPRGSYIPERRIEKILQKVEKRKVDTRIQQDIRSEEQDPQNTSPDSQSPNRR